MIKNCVVLIQYGCIHSRSKEGLESVEGTQVGRVVDDFSHRTVCDSLDHLLGFFANKQDHTRSRTVLLLNQTLHLP